jgi:hypothetical protein
VAMNRQTKRMMAKQGTDKPKSPASEGGKRRPPSAAPKREKIGPKEYLGEVRRLSRETADGRWIRGVVTELLEWLEEHRLAATVYFARSSGLDMTIEALRRETRIEQVNVFMRAIRATATRPLSAPDVGVMAVGLVAVIETAAACWLTQDAVFRGLGRHRFLADAADLAERILVPGGSAPAVASDS